MGRLDGKVAVITGGNSGIGACAAELFAKEGAKVVISARRVEQLEAVADKIKAAGGEALAVPCDISDKAQCSAVITKTLETFGTVDILVNNAGVVDSGIEAVEKVTDETIDTLIDINTKGTLYMTREAAKVMVGKKDRLYCECCQCGRLHWRRRCGLCGKQGGNDWHDQKYRDALCQRQRALQRPLSGQRRDTDDNGHEEGKSRPGYDGGDGKTCRLIPASVYAGGGCQCDSVPCRRRVLCNHRTDNCYRPRR